MTTIVSEIYLVNVTGRDRPGLIVYALLDLVITLRGAGENLEAEALLYEAIGLAESAPMPGALLANALKTLNERERHILTRRRLQDEPATLEDLSQEYGISRERVRQIEVRAFEKVQKDMKKLALERRYETA